ncbi:MAG: hypothetical protein IJM85_06385, partial [Clostridia bacterium]|nr:hypothetical protein [Clostridia bacterium]
MTATVTPVLSLYSGFWGANSDARYECGQGKLVYNQSQKHPYKQEFIDSLREDTSVSNEHSDNSNCKQMRRIIEIEK